MFDALSQTDTQSMDDLRRKEKKNGTTGTWTSTIFHLSEVKALSHMRSLPGETVCAYSLICQVKRFHGIRRTELHGSKQLFWEGAIWGLVHVSTGRNSEIRHVSVTRNSGASPCFKLYDYIILCGTCMRDTVMERQQDSWSLRRLSDLENVLGLFFSIPFLTSLNPRSRSPD